MSDFRNPFRPGAGHPPPYLAGREEERQEFIRLLEQKTILENIVLTGLRGVGKTVLLDSLKPLAIEKKWLWVGTDLSESTSVSEEKMAVRICTDLAVVTSGIIVAREYIHAMGFQGEDQERKVGLTYNVLMRIYQDTPGLVSDKLKTVLAMAWSVISQSNKAFRGIIFSYDEAQNLSEQTAKDQYPLSLLLDVFQSIQKRGLPLMLVLTGLPTLFPKLVEARTFSERMFHVVFLRSLNNEESREAILKPVGVANCPISFNEKSVRTIINMSGGYPYFIQFICREVYDSFIQKLDGCKHVSVPVDEIERKLDSDFFAGRWARATDRQRELLSVIAQLDDCDEEFTVHDIVELSRKKLEKPFSSSHVNQMLLALSRQGLVFKNRHGRYTFSVPLLGRFINRQG